MKVTKKLLKELAEGLEKDLDDYCDCPASADLILHWLCKHVANAMEHEAWIMRNPE